MSTTVDGRLVRCLSAAKQIELRTGADTREHDRHDLALLRHSEI